MPTRLLAVYLGGRVRKCNTELHDVVFVTGDTIEGTSEQLMDLWFGNPRRVHIDSWIDLQVVDGHRIALRRDLPAGLPKLYFVNLGAYLPGQFTELHANAFMVASSVAEVKSRAKREMLQGTQQLHTDDLFELDDCLEITEVGGYHVHLEPTTETPPLVPNNGYHPIPGPVVKAYAEKRKLAAE